jgi:hypothetical protein
VVGDLAYVADDRSGLRVIDVSNPAFPAEIGALDTPGNVNDVEVVGDLAYVADGSSGLRTIDVSIPASPVELGALDTPDFANDVEAVGDLAYVADGSSGLRIIDVSNPASPVELGTLDTSGFANDVEVVGDLAYVADGDGLRIIDVSEPAAPVELGALDTPDLAVDVAVVGSLAYVADYTYTSGLRVIDVSNPSAPVEIGAFDTPDRALDVEVVGDLAYVADYTAGLRVIDVSDPTFPIELGALDTPRLANDVEVVGDLAYVADGNSGLHVIEFGPEYTQEITVDLDIKPGSIANIINLLSRGIVRVAILGSDRFDVADVEASTLAFGPTGAAAMTHPRGRQRDTNRDGFTDLVSYHQTSETGIAWGDTEACLTGETLDGTPFTGCDAIYVLGSCGGGSCRSSGCGLGFELVLVLPPLMMWWRRARERRPMGFSVDAKCGYLRSGSSGRKPICWNSRRRGCCLLTLRRTTPPK